MQSKIQRVELNTFYGHPIFCPFCGQSVIDYSESETPTPCPHTLFIAHDLGFLHRDRRFDENLALVDVDDDDIELPEHGFDELTDEVTIPDALKFAAYVGPPSGEGTYVGFAPLDDEA